MTGKKDTTTVIKKPEPVQYLGPLTDTELLLEAAAILQARLGVVGYVRYLMLVEQGKDRLEHLRRRLTKVRVHELVQTVLFPEQFGAL